MGLVDKVEVPAPIKFVLNWGRKYSLWVMNFGLACCAIELIAASTSRHDFIRLKCEVSKDEWSIVFGFYSEFIPSRRQGEKTKHAFTGRDTAENLTGLQIAQSEHHCGHRPRTLG